MTELAEPFAMSQPAISKHLKVLERAGLISRGRDAQRRPRRLEATPLAEANEWLENYRRFWEESYRTPGRIARRAEDQGKESRTHEAKGELTMKTNTETLQITTPSDTEIAMRRVFDAPRRLVFDAHTRPELVKRWLGVRGGWSLAVCEIDLKVGGAYRYVWRGPDGKEMGMGGVFREIVRPERVVATEKFDDAWYPGEAVDTTALRRAGRQDHGHAIRALRVEGGP